MDRSDQNFQESKPVEKKPVTVVEAMQQMAVSLGALTDAFGYIEETRSERISRIVFEAVRSATSEFLYWFLLIPSALLTGARNAIYRLKEHRDEANRNNVQR